MGELTDGLLLHDIVLIILGTIFFLVMLVGFILRIARNEDVSQMYYAGFIIPIIMIAFPSIQRLSFSKDVVELEKAIERSIEQPGNMALADEIERTTENVKDRAKSEKSINTVAKGLTVTNPEKAVKYLVEKENEVKKSEDLQATKMVAETEVEVKEAVRTSDPEQIKAVTKKAEERKEQLIKSGHNQSARQIENTIKSHNLERFAPVRPDAPITRDSTAAPILTDPR